MAKKEKKPKEKKEKKCKVKKAKKEKKSKKNKDGKSGRTSIWESFHVEVLVYGRKDVVDLYLLKKDSLNTTANKYNVTIDAKSGVDMDGNIVNRKGDLLLCVYDVRQRETLKFLQEKIIPELKDQQNMMAIGGLGLEYRTGGGICETDVRNIPSLKSQYNCPVTELITCDASQLGAATFAFYMAMHPEKFTKAGDKHKDREDGEESKKKKKTCKCKRDKKEKKEKKEKNKKKK